ncbi:hypothetical protein AV530_009792 [Patagioenas fasciata monilis]|uniref:Uncharacterized protein n=1 Tax=Patagioenas fasciata monilis TaxID=372326 RepID=A0A1V4KA08_PATFA|nr:hypothetical protein AV530_009792 [Patagioenas fasciata monilis]
MYEEAANPSLKPTALVGRRVRVPFLAPSHGDMVTSGRNSENSPGNVLELERLIDVAMLTASYVHSLAKHQSRHGMRSKREISSWSPDFADQRMLQIQIIREQKPPPLVLRSILKSAPVWRRCDFALGFKMTEETTVRPPWISHSRAGSCGRNTDGGDTSAAAPGGKH